MIRKMLVIAAAVAMPASALAVGAIGGGVASAKGTPISFSATCAASGTITYAPPGLTHDGSVGTGKTSATTTSAVTFSGPGCGSGGTTAGRSIVSKNSKCGKLPNQGVGGATVPGCVKGDTYYGQASAFAGSGAANVQKALKKVSLTIEGITFPGKTSSTSLITPGGACGGEAGFQLAGTVKNKAYTATTFSLRVCLGADTGTNLSANGTTDPQTSSTGANSFHDIGAALGGDTSVVVATSAIDSSSSQLTIS